MLAESYPLKLSIGSTLTSPLFHDFPLHRVSRDGRRVVVLDRPFAVDDTSRVRITWLGLTGDTLLSKGYVSRAVSLTDAEWGERLDSRFSPDRPRPYGRREFLEVSRRPRAHAAVGSFVIARDGSLWLAREDSDPQVWVVLDPQGVPRFSVRLPMGLRIFDVADGRIYAVQLDDFDVPYVHVYRIE